MENNQDVLKAKSFINNEWVGSSSTDILEVINKYDQSPLAHIAYANASEIEFAISNSVQGFQTYSKLTAAERREFLLKIRQGLEHEKEKFIGLIISEGGKPQDYARVEIDRCLFILQTAADEAIRFSGEVIPMDFGLGVGKTAMTKRFPIGPILGMSPFNFPLSLALHKIAPALAVGCSVILKPSPYTPLTALAFASLCKKVGLPAGVLNVVICKNDEVALMLKDERIKMLSFTGSAEVGWMLKAKSEKKRVTLELGGNAAVIVDRSANIDEAVKAIATASYQYAGQVCISVQRIYVDQLIYDDFVDKFKSTVAEFKVGDPAEKGTLVGPIIDSKHMQRIHEWVQEAQLNGAELVAGGEILDKEKNVYAPTLLTNTNEKMKVVSEEVFGPVAIIEKVHYFDEAIREVNKSKYGLQAGLFTNQVSQMKYAHENLEVGALLINSVPMFRIDSMPYGGVKESGMGREGIRYSMTDMTEQRLLVY